MSRNKTPDLYGDYPSSATEAFIDKYMKMHVKGHRRGARPMCGKPVSEKLRTPSNLPNYDGSCGRYPNHHGPCSDARRPETKRGE